MASWELNYLNSVMGVLVQSTPTKMVWHVGHENFVRIRLFRSSPIGHYNNSKRGHDVPRKILVPKNKLYTNEKKNTLKNTTKPENIPTFLVFFVTVREYLTVHDPKVEHIFV